MLFSEALIPLQKLMFYIRLTQMGKICYNDGMYLRKTEKLMVWVQPPCAFLDGNLGDKDSTVLTQAQLRDTLLTPLKVCSQFPQMKYEGNIYSRGNICPYGH